MKSVRGAPFLVRTFLLAPFITRRERFNAADGTTIETEYNYSQGVAAIATLVLAIATFLMVLHTKRAADAAFESIRLAKQAALEQELPRLEMFVASYDSMMVRSHGPITTKGSTYLVMKGFR